MARKDPHRRPAGPRISEVATIEQSEVEGLSQGTIVRRRFFRHRAR